MKIETLNKYPIKAPKKKAFNIKTPDTELKLHQLNILVGVRGGGKTLAVLSKIKHFQEQDLCDRLFIISPTAVSNQEFINMVKINPDDIYDKPHPDSITSIIEKCDQEKRDWDNYKKSVENYNKMKKLLRSRKPLMELNTLWENLDITNDNILEEPTWRYNPTRQPIFMVVIDDCVGSPLYSTSTKSPLTNFLLRHRHISDGLGISVFMAVQCYTAQAGAIPPNVRLNVTSICIFKTKSEKALKKMAEEIGEAIDPELFMRAYKIATANPYGFLLVDFNPKDKRKYTFRIGWDKCLVLEDDELEQIL